MISADNKSEKEQVSSEITDDKLLASKPKREASKPKPFKGNKGKDTKPMANQSPAEPSPTKIDGPDAIYMHPAYDFGLDPMPINMEDVITPNYSKLIPISNEIFDVAMCGKDSIVQSITHEELAYYYTAVLWARLIHLKSVNARVQLTSEEKSFLKAIGQQILNVPQLIATYIKSVGNYVSSGGQETVIGDIVLPIYGPDNYQGYHALAVNADSHALFEDIPCWE